MVLKVLLGADESNNHVVSRSRHSYQLSERGVGIQTRGQQLRGPQEVRNVETYTNHLRNPTKRWGCLRKKDSVIIRVAEHEDTKVESSTTTYQEDRNLNLDCTTEDIRFHRLQTYPASPTSNLSSFTKHFSSSNSPHGTRQKRTGSGAETLNIYSEPNEPIGCDGLTVPYSETN